MGHPHRPWTPDDDMRLLAIGDLVNGAQAAVALGRSHRDVVRRHAYLAAAQGHGPAERRPWTEADDTELARLHFARVPVPEVAALTRRTPAAVRARAHGLGLRRRGRSKPARRPS